MTIESIVSYVGETNIAAKLDKDKLGKIARMVIEHTDQDKTTMKDWEDCVTEGVKLCKPEFKAKAEPWAGAANFKSTILTEAANTFGNRAAVEVMRELNLVGADVIGAKTVKNVIDRKASQTNQLKSELEPIVAQLQQMKEAGADTAQLDAVVQQMQAQIQANEKTVKEKRLAMRSKYDKADRCAELLNWQINYEMPEWKKEQKRLFYALPLVGTIIKETYYDDTLGRCVSKTIKWPDFVVNQNTDDLNNGRGFTHICAFTKSEFDLRVRAGIWEGDVYAEGQEPGYGSDEDSDSETTEDNPDKFYKRYCWLDLDDDGIEEPYIVTVHVGSSTVVRIVARYSPESIIVKFEDSKPMKLLDAQKMQRQRIDQDVEEFGIKSEYPDPEDLSGFEVVRIEPKSMLTKYGLIPSFDGTFLDVGYYHLIGSMSMGVNKTTNTLLNNGDLATMNGGWAAKGAKMKGGKFAVNPAEFIQTDIPPEQLANSFMPFPYKEPSQMLFMLLQMMEQQARGFSANVDAGIQANTAPTTALAMIQESMLKQTAHNSMIADSMAEEFNILYLLDRDYFDATRYMEIVGDDEAVFAEDFEEDGIHVTCTSNPETSSKMQRMLLAEAEMQQVPLVIQAGGNAVEIIKNYFNRIGSENTDKIFPNEAEMSPEDKAQMQAMQQQQQQANKMAETQEKLLTAQTEILLAGEKRKDAEFELSKQETLASMDKMLAEVKKINADTLLSVQKALTEHTNNGLSVSAAVSAEMDKAQELAIGNSYDQEFGVDDAAE
jgi:hypothetical protein